MGASSHSNHFAHLSRFGTETTSQMILGLVRKPDGKAFFEAMAKSEDALYPWLHPPAPASMMVTAWQEIVDLALVRIPLADASDRYWECLH